MRLSRSLSFPILALSLFLVLPGNAVAQEQPPGAELPVLVTSCGQSPGPVRFKVFMDRQGMEEGSDYVFDTLATGDLLAAGAGGGSAFKSVIIVTGASLKGMGAAGVSMDDELARIGDLIAEARRQGALIIAAHIEGMDRRAQGAAPGDNSDELSIDAVCPESDLLIVKSDGNADGRFTVIANEKNIPMIEFEMNMELGDVIERLFGK